MTIASGRNEFAPPPTPGFLRALALAILAHGLLVAMLTLGVQWKRDATPVAFEAELWSALPQEAAPPAPEVPPEPIAPPEPVKPAVPVEPPRPVVVEPPPVHTPDADIVLAKEKARLQKEKQLREEKLEQIKLEQEKQKRVRLEQEKQAEKQAQLQQAKLEKEKLAREKEKKDKLDQAARDKKLQEQRAQDAKAADAAKQKTAAKAKEDAKQLEELRQQNLKRMAGLAGAASGNGDARSTGTAAQSSGPSAGYAGRIRALLKRNTTYTETVVGNPTAEVEVRTSPDGTVISRKLVKSSGVKSWDEAVINAIDKAAVMPRDTDGRVPSPMLIVHSPKD